MKKLPPYGKRLSTHPNRNQSVFILTGDKAFSVASGHNSLSIQPKLVLPFSESPDGFKWPVYGRDCLILSHGKPEPMPVIYELAKQLILHGANFVLLSLKNHRMTKIQPGKEVAA